MLAATTLLAGLSACKYSPTTGTGPAGEQNVAILVVDDFGLGHPTGADDNAGTSDSTKDCGVSTNESTSGGANDPSLPLPADTSHGELVYQTVTAALQSDGFSKNVADTTSTPSALLDHHAVETASEWKSPDHGYTIRVEAVHTDQYDVHDILKNAADRLTALSATPGVNGLTYSKFVANLSFEEVPCFSRDESGQEVLCRYLQSVGQDPDVLELRSALEGTGYVQSLPEVLDLNHCTSYYQKLTTNSTPTVGGKSPYSLAELILSDPVLREHYLESFYRQFQNYKGPTVAGALQAKLSSDSAWNDFNTAIGNPGIAVIPVAAAGNGVLEGSPPSDEGLPFPFAPAIWDRVVSVSANALTDQSSRAKYSNYGEVMTDGTLWTPGPNPPPGGKSLPTVHLPFTGTSFAAPRVSEAEALYLAHRGQVPCLGVNDVLMSPLKYVREGSDTPWENLPRAQWDSKCQGFVETAVP
jgi:hypothetical protein